MRHALIGIGIACDGAAVYPVTPAWPLFLRR